MNCLQYVRLALAAMAVFAAALTVNGAPRPNIIVSMADDMGYSDLGCYGGEIRTPNIDRLAERGLRFTQFYNTSRCCPTRASLLTGLYPHQAGVGRMTFDEELPGYQGTLSRNVVTIAEVLRAAGYSTAMVGKWHLSLTKSTPDNALWVSHRLGLGEFSDPESYPTARGFDEYWGTIWGVVDFFDPFSLVHNVKPVRSVPKDFYYTDAISDKAVEYIGKYGKGEKPFFLYVAHSAPHWPLHALPEDIAKYKDTYKAGWDKIREARYRRMVKMGLIEADSAVLSERHGKEVRWEENPHREWDARAMAVHAVMIDRLDQGVGRILAKLKAIEQLDNTLILFFPDNGASPERPANFGPGFDRPSHMRNGTQIRYAVDKKVLPGPQDTYAGIGPMWANASNTPFRYWKKEQYEGGIATPLIAHWPSGIEAKEGSVTSQPGHVVDIMATAAELAGASHPKTIRGAKVIPIQGRSLMPILRGESRPVDEPLFWEHFGSRAVRQGDWKLVALEGQPWELYDLAKDRTETSDLAAKHPERVEELGGLWQSWAERAQVFPQPKPRP